MICKCVVLGFTASQMYGKWSGSLFIVSPPADLEMCGFSAAAWKIRAESVAMVRAALAGKVPAFVEIECVSRATPSGPPVNEVLGVTVLSAVTGFRGEDGKLSFQFGPVISSAGANESDVV